MAEPFGLEFSIKGQGAVERFLSKAKRDAASIEAQANRAEGRIAAGARQVGRSAFSTVGNQAIAFAAGEVAATLINQQTNNRLFGFLSQVGASTAAGFAFGGPVGGITAAVTGSISQLFGLWRESKAEQERLKAEQVALTAAQEQSSVRTMEVLEAQVEKLRQRIEDIRLEAQTRAFDVAWNTYQYL
jgi:hypothetical protein